MYVGKLVTVVSAVRLKYELEKKQRKEEKKKIASVPFLRLTLTSLRWYTNMYFFKMKKLPSAIILESRMEV